MISIDSAVNKLLKPLSDQYGFKKKRNTYIRVINDMAQVFNLKKLHGWRCSIEFNNVPLCAGHTYFGGIYDIEMFDPYTEEKYRDLNYIVFDPTKELVYSKDDESSILRLAEKIYCLSRDHMFPLFEIDSDTKSFFDNSIERDIAILKRKQEKRKCNDLQELKATLEYNLSWNSSLHAAALKNHNYEFAMKYIERMIRSYEEPSSAYYPEEREREFMEYHQKFCNLRDWIKNGEVSKIEAYVAEQESISLRAIHEKFGI